MENFIFGLQNIANSINDTLFVFIRHQLVWGFGFGFLASTAIHVLVMAENPMKLRKYMNAKTAGDAFESLAGRSEDGTYNMSYSQFQKKYSTIRLSFYIALAAFLLVVAIALLRY